MFLVVIIGLMSGMAEYDTLTLKDIQISNTQFSGSKVVKSFVLGNWAFLYLLI